MTTSLDYRVITLIAVLLSALLSALLIYLQYRQAVLRHAAGADSAQAALAELQPSTVDNLAHLLVQNFRVLNAYYNENLFQARTSSIASLAIAVIGFGVIIAGILIAFIGNQPLFGTATSVAGTISEAAAALFFRQNRVFLDQMQDSLKKLVSTQYLMTSVALAKAMDTEARSEEIRRINDHLRELMHSLHGLPSNAIGRHADREG